VLLFSISVYIGFLAPAASASTLPHPQTRVAAIEHPSGQPVGPSETILPGGSRPRAPSYDGSATGSSVAAEAAGDVVSVFKAPQPGLGASQFENGYLAEDFPGDGAYFAREETIAESFAYHYGEGVIETRIPADVYAQNFAEHEMPFLGEPPGTELAVPPSKLGLLSQYPRVWHNQP
jgi:hypothetical protein